MKTVVNDFDRHMLAATFAEAGEFETASEFIPKEKRRGPKRRKTLPLQPGKNLMPV